MAMAMAMAMAMRLAFVERVHLASYLIASCADSTRTLSLFVALNLLLLLIALRLMALQAASGLSGADRRCR